MAYLSLSLGNRSLPALLDGLRGMRSVLCGLSTMGQVIQELKNIPAPLFLIPDELISRENQSSQSEPDIVTVICGIPKLTAQPIRDYITRQYSRNKPDNQTILNDTNEHVSNTVPTAPEDPGYQHKHDGEPFDDNSVAIAMELTSHLDFQNDIYPSLPLSSIDAACFAGMDDLIRGELDVIQTLHDKYEWSTEEDDGHQENILGNSQNNSGSPDLRNLHSLAHSTPNHFKLLLSLLNDIYSTPIISPTFAFASPEERSYLLEAFTHGASMEVAPSPSALQRDKLQRTSVVAGLERTQRQVEGVLRDVDRVLNCGAGEGVIAEAECNQNCTEVVENETNIDSLASRLWWDSKRASNGATIRQCFYPSAFSAVNDALSMNLPLPPRARPRNNPFSREGNTNGAEFDDDEEEMGFETREPPIHGDITLNSLQAQLCFAIGEGLGKAVRASLDELLTQHARVAATVERTSDLSSASEDDFIQSQVIESAIPEDSKPLSILQHINAILSTPMPIASCSISSPNSSENLDALKAHRESLRAIIRHVGLSSAVVVDPLAFKTLFSSLHNSKMIANAEASGKIPEIPKLANAWLSRAITAMNTAKSGRSSPLSAAEESKAIETLKQLMAAVATSSGAGSVMTEEEREIIKAVQLLDSLASGSVVASTSDLGENNLCSTNEVPTSERDIDSHSSQVSSDTKLDSEERITQTVRVDIISSTSEAVDDLHNTLVSLRSPLFPQVPVANAQESSQFIANLAEVTLPNPYVCFEEYLTAKRDYVMKLAGLPVVKPAAPTIATNSSHQGDVSSCEHAPVPSNDLLWRQSISIERQPLFQCITSQFSVPDDHEGDLHVHNTLFDQHLASHGVSPDAVDLRINDNSSQNTSLNSDNPSPSPALNQHQLLRSAIRTARITMPHASLYPLTRLALIQDEQQHLHRVLEAGMALVVAVVRVRDAVEVLGCERDRVEHAMMRVMWQLSDLDAMEEVRVSAHENSDSNVCNGDSNVCDGDEMYTQQRMGLFAEYMVHAQRLKDVCDTTQACLAWLLTSQNAAHGLTGQLLRACAALAHQHLSLLSFDAVMERLIGCEAARGFEAAGDGSGWNDGQLKGDAVMNVRGVSGRPTWPDERGVESGKMFFRFNESIPAKLLCETQSKRNQTDNESSRLRQAFGVHLRRHLGLQSVSDDLRNIARYQANNSSLENVTAKLTPHENPYLGVSGACDDDVGRCDDSSGEESDEELQSPMLHMVNAENTASTHENYSSAHGGVRRDRLSEGAFPTGLTYLAGAPSHHGNTVADEETREHVTGATSKEKMQLLSQLQVRYTSNTAVGSDLDALVTMALMMQTNQD